MCLVCNLHVKCRTVFFFFNSFFNVYLIIGELPVGKCDGPVHYQSGSG